MRKLMLVLVLTLIALPALSATAATPVGPAPAVDQAAGFCPYGAPSCNTHDDCDAYCGDPRFGLCEPAHWTGCCTCTG